MKKELNELEQEKDDLAFELLREFKQELKRKHIVNIILIISILLITSSFVYFISQYDFSGYKQSEADINNTNTGQQGDVNNVSTIWH